MILRATWPNQQCHSTGGRWLVNQVNGQSHQYYVRETTKLISVEMHIRLISHKYDKYSSIKLWTLKR